MELERTDSEQAAWVCQSCGVPVARARYCQACGAKLLQTDAERWLRGVLLPHLVQARRWILLVAGLYALRSVAFLPLRTGHDPLLWVSPNLALAAIHLGLFWWARRAPLAASVVALAVFVSITLLDALVYGFDALWVELFVKLMFATVLWQAIRAGLEVRSLRLSADEP